MRFLRLDQCAQGLAVAHVDDVGAVRDLMARRVLIAVDRDDFDAQPLQGDDDLLAEFARAQQHDAGGGRGERGAETHTEIQQNEKPDFTVAYR